MGVITEGERSWLTLTIVGEWPGAREFPFTSSRIRAVFLSPNGRVFARIINAPGGTWVVAPASEAERIRLSRGLDQPGNEVNLAVLGPSDNLAECDKWVSRGVRVYASSGSSIERVVAMLRLSVDLNVVVIDGCFQQLRQTLKREFRQAYGMESTRLSRREREIVDLIEQGLTNKEIALVTGLSLNTVEHHVRHLLFRVGASNRTEAVRRTRMLGF